MSIRWLPRNGKLAGQTVVEDDAQLIDVAAAVHLVAFATRLLGAHVGRRAQHLAVQGIVISPASRLASPKSMIWGLAAHRA